MENRRKCKCLSSTEHHEPLLTRTVEHCPSGNVWTKTTCSNKGESAWGAMRAAEASRRGTQKAVYTA